MGHSGGTWSVEGKKTYGVKRGTGANGGAFGGGANSTSAGELSIVMD